MIDERIVQYIQKIVGKEHVKLSEPMKNHTTLRIGGLADCFVTPTNLGQIPQLIQALKTFEIDYYVIGNGSNLLVSDDGFQGVIIQLYNSYSDYSRCWCNDKKTVQFKALSGISMIKLAGIAAKEGCTGFEFASGIPGSLGGGVCMNAGAYGSELKDVIVSVTVCDRDGKLIELSKEELELGYRKSIIQEKNYIVLQVVIELKQDDPKIIKEKMESLAALRKEKQPLEYPSAGSTFKRPQGYYAGKLISDVGLKGFAVGGVKVSEKHAGFVVNTGMATAQDFIKLTDEVTRIVQEQTGVKLELEVKKLGFIEG